MPLQKQCPLPQGSTHTDSSTATRLQNYSYLLDVKISNSKSTYPSLSSTDLVVPRLLGSERSAPHWRPPELIKNNNRIAWCIYESGKMHSVLSTAVTWYWYHYASPTSGEAYRDRRLTTNFELWVEIFCVPTCFHVRIPKPCLSIRLSVRTPRKDIIIASSISVLH